MPGPTRRGTMNVTATNVADEGIWGAGTSNGRKGVLLDDITPQNGEQLGKVPEKTMYSQTSILCLHSNAFLGDSSTYNSKDAWCLCSKRVQGSARTVRYSPEATCHAQCGCSGGRGLDLGLLKN